MTSDIPILYILITISTMLMTLLILMVTMQTTINTTLMKNITGRWRSSCTPTPPSVKHRSTNKNVL